MRSSLLTLGILLASVAPVAAQRGEPAPARTGWLGSLSAGQAEAKRTGKPLMVVVRCGP